MVADRRRWQVGAADVRGNAGAASESLYRRPGFTSDQQRDRQANKEDNRQHAIDPRQRTRGLDWVRYAGERQNNKIHEQVYTESVRHAADDRFTQQNREFAACPEEDRSPRQRDRVVQRDAKNDCTGAQLKGSHPDQAARNVLKYSFGANTPKVTEDESICNVESA